MPLLFKVVLVLLLPLHFQKDFQNLFASKDTLGFLIAIAFTTYIKMRDVETFTILIRAMNLEHQSNF